MKKLVFVLLLVSAPAFAEWTFVVGNDREDTYVDLATIRKKGNLVKMWTLFDFKTVKHLPISSEQSYLSAQGQWEYDCDEERMRYLYYSFNSGNMGGGEIVFSDNDPRSGWSPVPPGSNSAVVLKLVCKP